MGQFGRNAYYFEQLREFVPRDALQILDQQKQRVSQAIDDEVTAFAKDLLGAIEKASQKLADELDGELKSIREEVDQLKAQLAAVKVPQSTIDQLGKLIGDHNEKWRGIGTKIGSLAKGLASKATGLPLG